MKSAFAAVASVLFSMSAFATDAAAGEQRFGFEPVGIERNPADGTYIGWGAVSTARYSSDTSQDIACATYAWGALCALTDANGNQLACFTNDATYLPKVAAVNFSSWIMFSADPNGYCAGMTVENTSIQLP